MVFFRACGAFCHLLSCREEGDFTYWKLLSWNLILYDTLGCEPRISHISQNDSLLRCVRLRTGVKTITIYVRKMQVHEDISLILN